MGFAVGGLGQGERFTQDSLVLYVTQQARVHHRALAQHLHTQHPTEAPGQQLDAHHQGQQSTTRHTKESSAADTQWANGQQLDTQQLNGQLDSQ